MERRVAETTLGAIPVWSRSGAGEGPIAVVIRGAHPKQDAYEDLELAGADIAWLHLPGFFSPTLAQPGIDNFAQAFSEALEQMFPSRPLLLIGVSTGALTAMAMKSPTIRGRVLVEPFLSTEPLWPFAEWLRHDLRASPDPVKAKWAEAVFGVTLEGIENRDYSHLLPQARFAWVLVGSEPLMPRRPMRSLPSLTSEDDRARLVAAGARLIVAPGGHDIPQNDPELFRATIERALVGAA
jgi:hypothetical protein